MDWINVFRKRNLKQFTKISATSLLLSSCVENIIISIKFAIMSQLNSSNALRSASFTSLFDILKNETRLKLDRIYSSSFSSLWACQAIFQSLSPLSRTLIMRFLFLDTNFKLLDLYFIMHRADSYTIQHVFDELLGLHLIVEYNDIFASSIASSHPIGNMNNPSIDLTEFIARAGHLSQYLNNTASYQLNPQFQKSLRSAITQPANPWAASLSQLSSSHSSITRATLENYRKTTWNKVLGYLVGLTNEKEFKGTALIPNFMESYGLMLVLPPNEAAIAGKRMLITAKGYEYMLKDYYQQIWEFVINRLFHSESYEDCMSLLFLLSYTEFGRPYVTDILNKTQKLMLFELSQVGIVFIPDLAGNIFYPTKVAINIVFGYQSAQHLSSVSGAAKNMVSSRYSLNRSALKGVDITKVINPHEVDKGAGGPSYGRTIGNEVISVQNTAGAGDVDSSLSNDQLLIIVETNLQIVAYVTNDLYFALLRLFVEVAVRLPNMVMGRLSRDKAKLAYRMGMRSAQIIDFLIVHAHPVMKARNTLSSNSKATAILPDNVIDQLILWESELSRIQTKDALSIDLKNLVTMKSEQFQQLMNKLNALNLVFWENLDDRCFVCDPNAQKIVEDFLRDHGLHFLS